MSDIWFKKMIAVITWMTLSKDSVIRGRAGCHRHAPFHGEITYNLQYIFLKVAQHHE